MNEISATRTADLVALEIRTLHRQAQRMVLGYAIEIGRRLREAKELVPYGSWGEWLRTEVDYSQSTANNFMRIFDEYGAAQLGLFGPEADSQTLGNLSYTKALSLLALPADERESFAEANNVEDMSTRELQQALKELNEARQAQEQLEESNHEMEKKISDITTRYDNTLREVEDADNEIQSLRAELKELQSRPIEVAVQEPDPAVVEAAAKAAADQAVKDAKSAYEKKEAGLKAKLEGIEKKRDKLEAELKAMEEKLKNAAGASSEETEQLKREAEALRAQLKTADPDTAAFKVHFEMFQDEWNRMTAITLKLPSERAAGLRKAMGAVLETMRNSLGQEGAGNA